MEELQLNDFQYNLPDERIARFPLPQRDRSKLLEYRQGKIDHRSFRDLPDQLPSGSLLVFNDTKVIPARLHFRRSTGATIELFLLNPVPADRLVSEAMQDHHQSIWQCMIGNRKRWKPDEVLEQEVRIHDHTVLVKAHWHDAHQSQVRFEWTPGNEMPGDEMPGDESFAAILHEAGKIPLPPYLNRDVTEADKETYQTVYSRIEGAVAAPTAGLHFTPEVLAQLAQKGIKTDYLTLHVGAGTFQPIKTSDVRQHAMHSEQVVYSRQNLQHLLTHTGPVIAVGTTSMRSLESLYWFGVRLLKQEPDPWHLDQKYAYSVSENDLPEKPEAVRAVLNYLEKTGQEAVIGHTGIYCMPGYRFRITNGLVTNFHQPGSTLILLIAAFVGENWRTIYKEALQNGYRFLSYGDSSLLLP
ncbi:S-adenosylmethionine:tRNA ribosyltransferase-isomerase [Larkinella rosea]|uniref:S-adenosylmethionine:tRNA ribosyltransferase-isomerase n=1 Tax=Larkinella rosea TaxID=2025312 RepID=A0A3P1B9I4_9BACT|nr:S-adenosylmethionine:tRNA ribosyltransferase-isomerase [Larkinella rosea]RRA97770.1 S-adenosylmethionine:tRNA ribosyltransferase-isomerase [Larkinella rosea]